MASEVYKRVKQRQLQRRKRERLIKITALLVLAAIVLAAMIMTKACSSRPGKQEESGETTSRELPVTTAEQVDAAVQTREETEAAEEPEESGKFLPVEYHSESNSYVEIRSREILSPYVVLVDINHSEILAGRKYRDKIYPASMTKVMTLIVAVDNLDNLEEPFTMTAEIIGPLYSQQASMAGFAPGEQICAKDLLYGVILPSGADACVGIATLVAGSEEKFVELMNQKCGEMGLKNTHFTNTSGLYDENHYTTPEEMAMIMEYAMSNELCREVLSTYQYTTAATPEHPEGIPLTSTMFSRMYGNEVKGVNILAGKTGYTDEAGCCLVSYAERGEERYVAVTAKAGGKWNVIFDDFYLYGKYIPNPPGYARY